MDEVIYIYDDEVEDLTLYMVKEYEASTDETTNTKREKINNKDNSSLEEY